MNTYVKENTCKMPFYYSYVSTPIYVCPCGLCGSQADTSSHGLFFSPCFISMLAVAYRNDK